MNPITCKHCGAEDNYRLEQRGPHNTAVCNKCDRYIKHMPKEAEPTFHFGPYNGKKVSEVMDADYLQEMWDNMKVSRRMMEAIDQQLQHIHSIS